MIDLKAAFEVRCFLDLLKKQMFNDEYKIVSDRVEEYQGSEKLITATEFQYYVDGLTDGIRAANMKVDKGLVAAGYKKA